MIDDAMLLAEFRVPQYTFDPLDIGVRKLVHKRFTMPISVRLVNELKTLNITLNSICLRRTQRLFRFKMEMDLTDLRMDL